MDSEDLAHFKQLLDTHQRRLRQLEVKKAWYGGDVPVSILMDIEEVHQNIADCQSQISAFPKSVVVSGDVNQFQTTDNSKANRKQVEITFNGPFDHVTPEVQSAIVRAIAGIVEISPDQVAVLKVRPGSVIFSIELPSDAADTLVKMYESGDEIIKELGIEKIGPASEQDLPLSKLVENAAVEQENYFTYRQADSRFSYEIFRRALVEQNELALKAIKDLYSNLVQRWIQRWQDKHEFESLENKDMDELVNSVFERVWVSLSPSKLERLKSLASILKYIQMSVHGMMTDNLRKLQYSSLELALEREALSDAAELDDKVEPEALLQTEEFWQLIRKKTKDPKEYIAVYASLHLDLSPREILAEYPGEFRDRREIYQHKANFLERLERDEEIQEFVRRR